VTLAMAMGMAEKRRGQKPRWWLGAVLVYIATKAKTILAVLKFTKIGATLISMLLTVGAYAIVFPVHFAIGLVVMILIHEMGHVVAAKQKGLPVSAPIFIPFVGALITMKKHPRDAATEAYIAFGGPILGTAGALTAFLFGVFLHSDPLLVVASIGFFLNLINLLPIHPLDGGRIAAAVTRWLWLVGFVGGFFVILWLRSILFFVIWLMFAWDLYQKFVKRRAKNRAYTEPFSLTVPLDQIGSAGTNLSGQNDARELPFDTFSTLDGQQNVRVYWEELGVHETIAMPRHIQALIKKVHVTEIEQHPKYAPQELRLRCQIDYVLYEPDNYYDVSPRTRLYYGLVYAAMAILLTAMLWIVRMQGISAIA
jgi:Zn-dependent protease